MIHIKRLIDKVSIVESKQGKDVVLPIAEARALRDELAKMLADHFQSKADKPAPTEQLIQVEIKGGTF